MSNFEDRLKRDARAVRQIRSSDENADQLRRQISTTRQVSEPPTPIRAPAFQGWLIPFAAAAALVLAIMALPQRGTNIPTANPEATTVALGEAATPSTTESPALEAATYTVAPLEEEWERIQGDLESARDKIQQDLSLQF
ncbi:MAG: hypothetical protein AB8F65_01260 [Woeseiaceae bacterium]